MLDYHTVSSTPTGDPYYRFDTKRTELGELLHRLKYRSAPEAVGDIADTVHRFLLDRGWPIQAIVSAPPSLRRSAQPIPEVAKALSDRLRLPFRSDASTKGNTTPQMKNIDDWQERQKLLTQAIQPGGGDVRGELVLLLDDLIESGSTLRCSGEVLVKQCGVSGLYALVLTRTK